jgi:hypothetical protein
VLLGTGRARVGTRGVAGPDAVIMRGLELWASDHTHAATHGGRRGRRCFPWMTRYPSHWQPP